MHTALVMLAAMVIGLSSSYVIERVFWPKRRKTILSGIDATLAVAGHLRVALEDIRRRDPQVAESCELALMDLSEQEFRLRRDKTVIRWT